MNILVLGGTGFIGPYVVRQLHEVGYEVTLFHRGQTQADLPEVKHIFGDKADLSDFKGQFERASPDVVLDMSPVTAQDAWTTLQTFRGLASRLVTISSLDVYRAYDKLRGIDPGPPDPTPLTETSPLRERLYLYRRHLPPQLEENDRASLNEYDKILVERIALSEPELPATVLRLPAVHGPGDEQKRFSNFVKRMQDERPLIFLSDAQATWRFSRSYAENVAHAIVLALTDKQAAGETYNVSERSPTQLALGRTLAKIMDWRGEFVTPPLNALPEFLQVFSDHNLKQDWTVDDSKLRRELGYREIVPWEDGLERTVAWLRDKALEDLEPALFDYAAEDAALAALGKF